MTQAGVPSAGAGRKHSGLVRLAPSLPLALILVTAAAARLWFVDQPLSDAYSWREASTAMMADNFRLRSWNIFYPEVSWTGPGPSYQGREFQLYSWMVAVIDSLFGQAVWHGRAVSAAFGLLTTFSLHRLVALTSGTRQAHAAAAIYAINPAAAMIDSSFLPDPAMLALVTTGVWLLARYSAGGGNRNLWLGTAAFTLGALAKLPGAAAGLVPAYLGVVHARSSELRKFRMLLAAGVLSALALASYYAWAIYLGSTYPPHHVAGHGYFWQYNFGDLLAHTYRFLRFAILAYGYPLLALAMLGFAASFAARKRSGAALAWVPHIWLLAWCILWMLAAEEISNNVWNAHLLNAPMAMFAGAGALLLIDRARGRAARAGVAAAVAGVVLAFSTVPSLRTFKTPYAADSVRLGRALSCLASPQDTVITVARQVGDPVAIYYSGVRGWVFPPGGGNERWGSLAASEGLAIRQLEALRAQGADWLGFATAAVGHDGRTFMQHHAGVIAHLDRTARLVQRAPGYAIYRLNPQPAAPGGSAANCPDRPPSPSAGRE